MTTLVWVFVIVAGIVGLVAVQWKRRIRANVRASMLSLAGVGLLAVAALELARITAGFRVLKNLLTIDGVVPLGWMLGSAFVLLYAWSTYRSSDEHRSG